MKTEKHKSNGELEYKMGNKDKSSKGLEYKMGNEDGLKDDLSRKEEDSSLKYKDFLEKGKKTRYGSYESVKKFEHIDRMAGSILGFAIGDAMGAPNEFNKKPQILKKYEPSPIKGLKEGQYTDDTQHMEISLDSLLENYGNINLQDNADRLVQWYKSGNARSIGRTTELAIKNLIKGMGYNKSGIDHINSCGALGMARLVPFSLISAINGYKTNTSNKLQKKDIRKILGITHRHKKVCDMGLIFNYFIQEGMHGRSPKETIDMILFEDDFLNKKIRQKLKIAKQLSESKEDIYQTIQEIGNSGFVEDVMYSSIYSALKGSSFEESILISANGGGDSDSRAAITGALCGLETGVSEIPNHLKKGLERSEDLEKKARLLYYLRK